MTKDDVVQELGITPEEAEEGLQGLVAKGLLKETVIDGVIHYDPTYLGTAFHQHSKSDPDTQN